MKRFISTFSLSLLVLVLLTGTTNAQSKKSAFLARAKAAAQQKMSATPRGATKIADVTPFDTDPTDITDPNDESIKYASFVAGGEVDGTLFHVTVDPALPISTFDSDGNVVPATGGTDITVAGGIGLWVLIPFPASGTYTVTATGSSVVYSSTRTYGGGGGPETNALSFSTPPTSTLIGSIINSGTGVKVSISGAPFSGTVTVALASGPVGAVLHGTTTVNAIDNLATFNDLWINKVSNNYTLSASATGLTGATSGSFEIGARTTSTVLATSSSSAVYGTSLTFTATVSAPGSLATPTGSVSFLYEGGSIGEVPLNGSGVAQVSTSALLVPGSPHSITATYLGDTEFNGGNSNVVSQTITPIILTAGITANGKEYDATTAATFVRSPLSGVLVTDNVTLTGGTATFADKNVGTKTVTVTGLTLSGTAAGNYELASTSVTTTAVISAKPLTVTGITANKVYDGNATATLNTGSIILVGAVTGDDVSLSTSGATATFDTKNVGTGKTVTVVGLTISGADAGNYSFTHPTITADITARLLTVSVASLNKVYDGNAAATVTLSDNRVAGDLFTYSFTSATFADKNKGTGKPVTVSGISITGGDAANYTLSNNMATTTADITARPLTVTATGVNKVYDGTTAAIVTLSDNRVAGDGLTDNYTSASFADPNVGIGKTVTVTGISISGTDASNYALGNTTATATADIATNNSNTALISSVNPTVYGQSATFTATVTGTAGIPTGTVSFMQGTTTLGTGLLNASGLATFNTNALSVAGSPHSITAVYPGDINFIGSTSAAVLQTITPKALTVTGITANGKVYDGNTSATLNTGTTAFTGVVNGDVVSLNATSATGVFDTKAVGTGKAVTISGLTLSGAGSGNYTLTQPAASATITAKNLTVTGVTANNKIYDGNTTATLNTGSAQLVSAVSGDAVSLSASGATAVFATKTVGTGKAVTISGLTLSGADAGNYTLTQPTTTANITAKNLTVTGITANNKVFDGTTTATLNTTGATLVGVVSGDAVTLSTSLATGTFSDPTVGTGKTVTISGLTISGANVGNYTLTQPTTTANITAAQERALVAGAGLISSPTGSYPSKPTFAGKGYFAFAASTLGNGPVPIGATAFVLKYSGLFSTTVLTFGSASYDHMVLSGARVTYGGVGTVNGSSGYGFFVSTLDGSSGTSDKFRIKIWDKNHGNTVVYDSQLGAADDAAPTSVVSGGVITITKSGNGSTAALPPSIQEVMDKEASTEIPAEYTLYNAYPNPFNPSTSITFDLPEPAKVRLAVFDMLGREVAVLVDEESSAGHHTVRFDASRLSSGTYIYRLQAGNFVQTKKLMLMK